MAKAELAFRTPRRFAFTRRSRACRQVLECARASAAFRPTPAVLSGNTYRSFTIFRADATASKNFVSHPILALKKAPVRSDGRIGPIIPLRTAAHQGGQAACQPRMPLGQRESGGAAGHCAGLTEALEMGMCAALAACVTLTTWPQSASLSARMVSVVCGLARRALASFCCRLSSVTGSVFKNIGPCFWIVTTSTFSAACAAFNSASRACTSAWAASASEPGTRPTSDNCEARRKAPCAAASLACATRTPSPSSSAFSTSTLSCAAARSNGVTKPASLLRFSRAASASAWVS